MEEKRNDKNQLEVKKIKVMCDRRKAQGRTRKGIGPC